MNKIEHVIRTHIDCAKMEFRKVQGQLGGFPYEKVQVRWTGFKDCSVAELRKSYGFEVRSFRELVEKISQLGYENSGYNLLFRGQLHDVLDKNGRTKILPGIFRPRGSAPFLHPSVLNARLNSLKAAVEKLSHARRELHIGDEGLYRHPEYYLAILQHYRMRKTPLLDATQSLRVAASFALENNASAGVLYVLGMPHPQGSISHFIDADITLVKLQNVCPPSALRPHYQEGFLLGRLSQVTNKQAGDNAAYRLLGKYSLYNKDGNFWEADFPPIPWNALLPSDDPFGHMLSSLLGSDDVP